jgi:hypothetical protein
VDLEYTNGRLLLTWERPEGAKRFRIYRSISELTPGLNEKAPSPPILLPRKAVQIATTDKSFAVDPTANPFSTYTYYVVAEYGSGVSERSNFVNYPAAPKPVTSKDIAAYINACGQRNCFTTRPAYLFTLSEFSAAVQAARRGEPGPLLRLQTIVKLNRLPNSTLMRPFAAEDLELRLSRLIKRYVLYQAGLLRLTDL